MGRPKGSKNKPKNNVALAVAGEGSNLPAVQREQQIATIADAAAMPICHDVFATDPEDGETEEAVSLNLKRRYERQTPEERAAAQARFLSAFRQTARVDLACRAAGVKYDMVRAWREHGGRFRERFEDAKDVVIALLESRLAQISLRDDSIGNRQALTAVLAQLNALFPEKYRPKTNVDVTHRVIRDYGGMRW